MYSTRQSLQLFSLFPSSLHKVTSYHNISGCEHKGKHRVERVLSFPYSGIWLVTFFHDFSADTQLIWSWKISREISYPTKVSYQCDFHVSWCSTWTWAKNCFYYFPMACNWETRVGGENVGTLFPAAKGLCGSMLRLYLGLNHVWFSNFCSNKQEAPILRRALKIQRDSSIEIVSVRSAEVVFFISDQSLWAALGLRFLLSKKRKWVREKADEEREIVTGSKCPLFFFPLLSSGWEGDNNDNLKSLQVLLSQGTKDGIFKNR